MAEPPPAKRARKGTRSCVECRHRKIRCIWPDASEACEGCTARGRLCQPQVFMTPSTDQNRTSARSRIGQLQNDVSSLWNAVHSLEAKVGCPRTDPRRQSSPGAGAQDGDSQDGSDTDASALSPPNMLDHLRPLFDNDLLGSNGQAGSVQSPHGTSSHMAHGVAALRRLLPPRQVVLAVASQAASWLSVYNSLFPMSLVPKTSDGLMAEYDKLDDPSTGAGAIAAVLLFVAITLHQLADETLSAITGLGDTPKFVKDVSSAVERVVVSDDNLAGTLDGIQATLLFLRLLLGRGRLRKTWILLRRTIALAELAGLPRASIAVATQQSETPDTSLIRGPASLVGRKAEIWESICALDRMMSLMWSLPLATAQYPLPQRAAFDAQGNFSSQFYLYKLTGIAMRVMELDALHSAGRPMAELFNTVISIDQDLRALAMVPPKGWWRNEWPVVSVEAVLQLWHQYMVVRTQLHFALAYDESQQFAFSFVVCLDASRELAKRYIGLRKLFPPGFLAAPMLDLEVFTAVVFLLLANYRSTRTPAGHAKVQDTAATAELIDEAIRTMEGAVERAGGEFSRQQAKAMRALEALLKQPQSAGPQEMTLTLPLVGQIHVARKPRGQRTRPTQPTPEGMGIGITGEATSTTTPFSDSDLVDSLSLSMEFPEDFPFLTDDVFASGDWF